MDSTTITAVSAVTIQRYIFGSNNLREIIGASHLVHLSTGDWADEAAGTNGGERIYSGGGSTILKFPHPDQARAFARILTTRILTKAPGLPIQVTHDWPDENNPRTLISRVQCALRRIKQKRFEGAIPGALDGISVTQTCSSTGRPATGWDRHHSDRPRMVSSETRAKLDNTENANARVRTASGGEYATPLDLDHLGGTLGEDNYIAVVHIDGNRMGERVVNLARGVRDEDYVNTMHAFTEDIDKATTDALERTLQELVLNIQPDQRPDGHGWPSVGGRVLLDRVRRNNGGTSTNDGPEFYMPFRPLIYGGDDITFVCDGRLGVALAARMLHHLRNFGDLTDEQPLNACAGVSIVKAHFPLSVAFELADELCQSAKELSRRHDNTPALDWHIAQTGLLGSLKEIRKREYHVPGLGSLTVRPLLLTSEEPAAPDAPIDWLKMEQLLKAFQDKDWAESRNKSKALRDVLREGPHAVKTFRGLYLEDRLLPMDGHFGETAETGWLIADGQEGRCAYFDAVELMDYHVTLETKDDDTPA